MPLPFILGGLAVAALGAGAKAAIDGYSDSSEADEIEEKAKKAYETAKEKFKYADQDAQESLGVLGDLQLKIGSDFQEFDKLAQDLLKRIRQHRENQKLQLNIPKNELNKIQAVGHSAVTYLGSAAAAGAVGAGAAYAAYGGVMALAAASTGTPIAALSGAAAYNATMAAIGGGSIAAGGFGMAGGAAILGGVVAAPVALIAGIMYASHAEEKLKKAKEYRDQVDDAIGKIDLAIPHLVETKEYANKIEKELARIYQQLFIHYFDDLKAMNTLLNRNKNMVKNLGKDILNIIENGYKAAEILTNIITTPLFKYEKDSNGKPKKDEEGVVIFSLDKSGTKIINSNEIDDILHKTKNLSLK